MEWFYLSKSEQYVLTLFLISSIVLLATLKRAHSDLFAKHVDIFTSVQINHIDNIIGKFFTPYHAIVAILSINGLAFLILICRHWLNDTAVTLLAFGRMAGYLFLLLTTRLLLLYLLHKFIFRSSKALIHFIYKSLRINIFYCIISSLIVAILLFNLPIIKWAWLIVAVLIVTCCLIAHLKIIRRSMKLSYNGFMNIIYYICAARVLPWYYFYKIVLVLETYEN